MISGFQFRSEIWKGRKYCWVRTHWTLCLISYISCKKCLSNHFYVCKSDSDIPLPIIYSEVNALWCNSAFQEKSHVPQITVWTETVAGNYMVCFIWRYFLSCTALCIIELEDGCDWWWIWTEALLDNQSTVFNICWDWIRKPTINMAEYYVCI